MTAARSRRQQPREHRPLDRALSPRRSRRRPPARDRRPHSSCTRGKAGAPASLSRSTHGATRAVGWPEHAGRAFASMRPEGRMADRASAMTSGSDSSLPRHIGVRRARLARALECPSACVGEGVHDLVVKLVDSAPCEQAVGDRALKRRARLTLLHVELPAHQLQAGLLELGDRLEDLPDRQLHRADERYPGPHAGPAVDRAAPVARPDPRRSARSARQSARSAWTYARQPPNDGAPRGPRRIG
jgi:hypothetical protein